jgi:hypothetical protein
MKESMIYTYCNSNKKKQLELSCENNNLKKIHNYTLRDNEILIEIYTCSKCNGLWKKVTFNKLTKWLKVGDVTVKQEEYIPFDSVGFYPIEHFEIEEAYDYDNYIFCGNPKETKFYSRLTCSPTNLILIDKINEKEAIGWSTKTEIFKCSKCDTKWEITTEFDSHHGYATSAKII